MNKQHFEASFQALKFSLAEAIVKLFIGEPLTGLKFY